MLFASHERQPKMKQTKSIRAHSADIGFYLSNEYAWTRLCHSFYTFQMREAKTTTKFESENFRSIRFYYISKRAIIWTNQIKMNICFKIIERHKKPSTAITDERRRSRKTVIKTSIHFLVDIFKCSFWFFIPFCVLAAHHSQSHTNEIEILIFFFILFFILFE